MDSKIEYIVPVEIANKYPVTKVGGKAKNLSFCQEEKLQIPKGFVITTEAYFEFLHKNNLTGAIDKEIVRRKMDEMRWEEIWDSALRIRHSFIKGKLPENIEKEVLKALCQWPDDTRFAVRSSSPDEDSKEYSFAGVHESFVNVLGIKEVMEKIKLVWASLWSDKALLYRKEKGLNSGTSSMAVLVQKMEYRDISGLAFSIDPSKNDKEHIILEAVKGSLDLLVDNKKTPDRFKIRKKSGEVVELSKGSKTLGEESIRFIYNKVIQIEDAFGEPVDIEWTGIGEDFTVLQVRPITNIKEDNNKDRLWYLTLTPSGQNLIDLAERVEKRLIPEMKADGEALDKALPENLKTEDLVEGLKIRGEKHSQWKKIYWDEFIPFANGIRNFGSFYNELIKPSDPYEFVALLKNENLLAQKRDMEMKKLANILRESPRVKDNLQDLMVKNLSGQELLDKINPSEFLDKFKIFLNNEMNVSYDNTSLESVPEIHLRVILELVNAEEDSVTNTKFINERKKRGRLREKYLKTALEKNKLQISKEWLRIGQVSWKLRDDDNILLGKIENQLILFLMECLKRLHREGEIDRMPRTFQSTKWEKVYNYMVGDRKTRLVIEVEGDKREGSNVSNLASRQLVGNSSSEGVYTGKARVIKSILDFKGVEKGEVLVFDAIQPQMTFIISLAGAIVERRGGMLVHSSIIAREMKIPAVNGVTNATKLIKTGDMVTVNGDMGVITVGRPEFGTEFR